MVIMAFDVIFVSVVSNLTGAVFPGEKWFSGDSRTSYRNLGIFQIPVALCNFDVALPVTFFGGAYVAPKASL